MKKIREGTFKIKRQEVLCLPKSKNIEVKDPLTKSP